jgi:transposase-like protein
MSLLAVPPGRRRARLDSDREIRLRHIEVAYRMFTSGLSVRQIAQFYGISRETCYQWRNRALTYPDPEADTLRALVRDLGPSAEEQR